MPLGARLCVHACACIQVVVIGGGVCGMSAALSLVRRGHSVAVLERHTVGGPYQASAVNGGFIDVWSSVPASSVADALAHPGATLDEVLVAGSRALYADLASRGHAFGLRALGALWLCATPGQLAWAQGRYAPAPADPRTGSPAGALLSPAQLRALEPALAPGLLGAVYFPACATANPREAMVALAAQAAAEGVELHENAEVRWVVVWCGAGRFWRCVALRSVA